MSWRSSFSSNWEILRLMSAFQGVSMHPQNFLHSNEHFQSIKIQSRTHQLFDNNKCNFYHIINTIDSIGHLLSIGYCDVPSHTDVKALMWIATVIAFVQFTNAIWCSILFLFLWRQILQCLLRLCFRDVYAWRRSFRNFYWIDHFNKKQFLIINMAAY